MEVPKSTEHGENEPKNESMLAISEPKKSRKSDLDNIPKSVRLRILQQSAKDFGDISVVRFNDPVKDLHGTPLKDQHGTPITKVKVAIVLNNVTVDEHGNLVLLE